MLRIYIHAFVLLLCADVHAQVMPFKNYGAKDGLSNNSVHAIIRDDRGLLWVGTDLSLNWFDGKRFYEPKINTNIGQLYVNGFYKDRNGDMWVRTFFNGLYKYHNGQFTNYLIDSLNNAITNTILDVLQVSPDEYVVVSQQGVYLLKGKKFSALDPNDQSQGGHASNVMQLSDNTILLSTDNGIFLYAYHGSRWLPAGHILQGRAVNKMVIIGNRILAATDSGLISFKQDGHQISTDSPKIYLPGRPITNFITDPGGKIWVSVSLSNIIYKIADGKVTQYGISNGLPENVLSLYYDQGSIWFGSHKGLTLLGDEYYEFSFIKNGLGYQPVGYINTDAQKNLWMATSDGMARKKDSGYAFFTLAGKDQIGYVNCLCKNKNGVLLAATDAGVLNIKEPLIKKELNIHAGAITEDEKECNWIGDFDGRIWRYCQKQLTLMKPDHLQPEMITGMYVQNGVAWVGYRSTGMKKYRVAGDSLITITEYSAATGYKDFRVRCCTADKHGNVIFGTRTNGIYIFPAASDTLAAHITSQNGLNANWVKQIYSDTDGILYLATNNGINILSGDYKHPAIKQLKINNENIDRETNCIIRTGDYFLIGTIEGILKWIPGNMHKDTAAPPIYFRNITIQGLKDFSIAPYTADAGTISLPHDQHALSFDVAGITFKNPGNVRYHYMMEGESDEWGPATENNTAYYNLKPGTYTFRVVAENEDGVWSRYPAVFHFVIRPPFWNTWWFITAVAAAIIAAGYSAYRYKLNQVLVLEHLRNKISTDLHDDMGSTLSSISIISDLALQESSNTQVLKMINSIRENSTVLLEKMDDIVWSINPRNDTLENLMFRFRRFAATLLEAKNIEYTITVAPGIKDMKLSMDHRQHIYLILKETINNLIKYSGCTMATINVLLHDKMLEITVTDNGTGFDTNAKHAGNGLINLRERARQMNASVSIASGKNEGTKIILRLKIK